MNASVLSPAEWAGIALLAVALILATWLIDRFERDASLDVVHQRRRNRKDAS